jgi:phosphatidylserine/phosphatidylglycerophosphate/cardiolipin synthase-like enzyme
MHAKVVVCDDRAYVGSYNHSRSGGGNAENVLALTGGCAVAELAVEVEEVIDRYADGDNGAEPE